MIRWLEDADTTRLQSFLMYTVGSPSLKAEQKIHVKYLKGEGMASHTCFNTLEIPREMDMNMFNIYLDGLKGEKQIFDIV
ncbi:MAG: hypothetical protein WC222_03360 [Parachlamydiales bacterium]|jgi:hypothetical protein